MHKSLKKLGDAELELMCAVWELNRPFLRSDLNPWLDKKSWADTTVLTILSHLCSKQYLAIEKSGRSNIFTPLVTRQEYQQFSNHSFLNKLYGGAFSRMTAALVESGDLTEKDLEELQNILDRHKEEKEDV